MNESHEIYKAYCRKFNLTYLFGNESEGVYMRANGAIETIGVYDAYAMLRYAERKYET